MVVAAASVDHRFADLETNMIHQVVTRAGRHSTLVRSGNAFDNSFVRD